MRFIAKILIGIVVLLAALFAVANRGDVTISFSPLPFEMPMPLYAAVLGAFGVGLVVGTALALIGRERMRLRARAGEQRARTAEARLASEHAPPAAGPLVPAIPARARLSDD